MGGREDGGGKGEREGGMGAGMGGRDGGWDERESWQDQKGKEELRNFTLPSLLSSLP